jgi:hypothetical protein
VATVGDRPDLDLVAGAHPRGTPSLPLARAS